MDLPLTVGLSVEEVEKKFEENYNYILARVQRHIPPPEQLMARLQSIHQIYASIEDHRTGQKLFNAKAQKEWDNLMKHVQSGCLSDAPGIPLYRDRDEKRMRTGRRKPFYTCQQSKLLL